MDAFAPKTNKTYAIVKIYIGQKNLFLLFKKIPTTLHRYKKYQYKIYLPQSNRKYEEEKIVGGKSTKTFTLVLKFYTSYQFKLYNKNPAYGRHWISWPRRIQAPIPFIYFNFFVGKKRGRKNLGEV